MPRDDNNNSISRKRQPLNNNLPGRRKRKYAQGLKPFVSVSYDSDASEFTVTCRGVRAAGITTGNVSYTSARTIYLAETSLVFDTPASTKTLYVMAYGGASVGATSWGYYWDGTLTASNTATEDLYVTGVNQYMLIEQLLLNADGTHAFSGGGELIPGVGYKPNTPTELFIPPAQAIPRLYYSGTTLTLAGVVVPDTRTASASNDSWERTQFSLTIPASTSAYVYLGMEDNVHTSESAVLQLGTSNLYGYTQVGRIFTNADGDLQRLEDYTQEMYWTPMGLSQSITYVTGVDFGAETTSRANAEFINGSLVRVSDI